MLYFDDSTTYLKRWYVVNFLTTFVITDYTPYGVEHYTLWSVEDLTHEQVSFYLYCAFVLLILILLIYCIAHFQTLIQSLCTILFSFLDCVFRGCLVVPPHASRASLAVR